jgi:protein-disulfide isomerase
MRQVKFFWIISLLSLSAFGQQPAAHHAKAAAAMPEKPGFSVRLPSEETVNAFLQQMFGYDPAFTWKVAEIRPSDAAGLAKVTVVVSSAQGQQVSVLYITSDGQHALTGELMPFGTRPFDADRELLAKGLTGPSRGPAEAPATIVEFSDLQCPHCKDAQPILDKLMAEETNVRLVFQNFPLAIPAHDWAAKGAAYADCVGQASPDAFWKFIHDTYEAQTAITAANADEKLTALAEQDGAKGSAIAACAALPETTARVEASVALGRSVKVTGTPTLYLNGRKIENVSGIPYDVFKKLVDFAAKDTGYQATGK